jgi:hypothetical protein
MDQAPKILWRRLPTYFPNIKLIMYKPKPAQREQALRDGYLAKVRTRSLQLCHLTDKQSVLRALFQHLAPASLPGSRRYTVPAPQAAAPQAPS